MGLRQRGGGVGDGAKVSPARPPGSSWGSWVVLGLSGPDLWGCMGLLRPERDCGAWGTGLLCQASWRLGLLGASTRRIQPHPLPVLVPTPNHTSHYMRGSLTTTPPVTCQEPKNEAENPDKKQISGACDFGALSKGIQTKAAQPQVPLHMETTLQPHPQ